MITIYQLCPPNGTILLLTDDSKAWGLQTGNKIRIEDSKGRVNHYVIKSIVHEFKVDSKEPFDSSIFVEPYPNWNAVLRG